MEKKNITTREDGVTKDMQSADAPVRVFRFPRGQEVKAPSYQEALAIYKKSIKK